jgi:hypothetical protein
MLLLRNPIRGGQGPNWAVEPYDDDDDDDTFSKQLIALMAETVRLSETSIYFVETTWPYVQDIWPSS